MSVGDALDQAVQPEPSQVVGHLATRVLIGWAPEQLRDRGADVAMAEAGGAEGKQTQGLHESEHTAIAEAEGRGPLRGDDDGLGQGVEVVVADQAVVAQIFDAQQASVGGKADLLQGREIAKSPTDFEVVGVVDRGFGAKSLILFVGHCLMRVLL